MPKGVIIVGGSSSGGGGGGSLQLYKDGVLQGGATSLDFMGVGVGVNLSNGIGYISVPPANLPSHFNTLDGTTNARPSNITTQNRNIPDPLGTFDIGDWVVGDAYPCLNSANISYTSGQVFLLEDNTTTTFRAEVLDASGVTIAENLVTLTGNSDTTLQNVRVVVQEFNTVETNYQCKVTVNIAIGTILGGSGRFSVRLTHNNDGTNYIYSQNNIFYDSNPITFTTNAPTFSENTPITTYLSGVAFCDVGSTFNVGISAINSINRDSYKNGMLSLSGADFGLPTVTLNPSDIPSWNTNYNVDNLTYSKSDWEVTTTNLYRKGSYTVNSRTNDWVLGVLQNSVASNVLISTYVNNATRIYEDFRDESRRYRSNLMDLWDSTDDLSVVDSGTGLQAIGSNLIYPQEDFTTYTIPNVVQKNYSGLVGEKYWFTEFNYQSVSKSNGIFSLVGTDFSEASLVANDLEIEISLNGIDWFTLNQPYAGGSLNPNDGCRIDEGTYNLDVVNKRLRFTLGTGKFTGATTGKGWGLFVKITYSGSNDSKIIKIDSIAITDWI